jgi:hypothetical protein
VAVDLAGCQTLNGIYSCYTGQRYAWTPTATSNTATIQLGATIVDQTPATPGDISSAKVSFGLRDISSGAVSPISSATNLPVGLVSPTDKTIGTAGAAIQFSLSSSDICQTFNVAVLVSGNYKKLDAVWQDTQVTLCRAVPGSITSNPAATVSNTGSGGFLADTSSAQSTVSFSVKYTNKGTNPQGKVQLTVVSDHNSAGRVDGAVHTYEIVSNAISTLNVTNSTADFQAKCNVNELITNSDGSITSVNLDGGALMALSLDGSSTQLLGITVNKSKNLGGMWYSSAWDGKQTVNKPVVNTSSTPIHVNQ